MTFSSANGIFAERVPTTPSDGATWLVANITDAAESSGRVWGRGD